MVKFRNKLNGGDMYVDETRVEEYVRAGHVPACAAPEQPQAEQLKKAKKRTKKEA